MARIVAVALLASVVALFAFHATYADRTYPAVAVGDVHVGGMTIDEAVTTVEQRAEELERGTVTFTYNGQTWNPTLSELGAEIDVEASVDAAYELGRDDDPLARLGFTGELLRSDQRVPLRTTVDRTVLASWFELVNIDIGDRAANADLAVDGVNVTITPEKNGTIVDEARATELVLRALQGLEPISAELPTKTEQPQISAANLEGTRNDLAAALDSPMLAVFDEQEWAILPADLAQFLTVETTYESGEPKVTLGFERNALAAYLRDSFSAQVNRTPVDARIAWSSDQGGLIALDPSVDGAALRSTAFADAVAESFLGDQSPVEIPVVVTKPEIDSNNLDALGIDGRLARGDSNYADGSADRDTNIEIGTELLSGELIAPGEEFSFNGAVGEITADKGFVDAGIIGPLTLGREIGGGICQISTTVFRAALLAGMPIIEWWSHSLRLRGYERDGWTAGYDATILQVEGANPSEWGDFKFLNDTGGYMVVQAWNEYPYNIVEIYGTDDGREVEVGGAKFSVPDWEYEDKEVVDYDKPTGYMVQTQWPTEPYEAIFTRTVTYSNGEVSTREFYSPYQGSGNVWVVSPDVQGQSPASHS